MLFQMRGKVEGVDSSELTGYFLFLMELKVEKCFCD